MADVGHGGEVDRGGQLRRDTQCVGGGRRPVFPDDKVHRFGCDVVLREKRRHAGDAGRQRRSHRRMRQLRGDESFESRDELMNFFRREIEVEELHRDQALTLRVVGADTGPNVPAPI